MNPAEVCLTLPNFLIPYRNGGVEDYFESPETVGKLVLAVASKIFKGADISANLAPCEKGVYRQWLKVAEYGIEKATRERAKVQRAAEARWNGRHAAGSVATPAPRPAPVAPRPVPATPPAPVAPAPRPAPNPSGGARAIGDCMGNLGAMFGGGGIADMITAEPVKAALSITGETGNALAQNTFKKLLRTKGASAFCDTLFAFNSECKNGEEPKNRGAALVARLSESPDNPAGGKRQ